MILKVLYLLFIKLSFKFFQLKIIKTIILELYIIIKKVDNFLKKTRKNKIKKMLR